LHIPKGNRILWGDQLTNHGGICIFSGRFHRQAEREQQICAVVTKAYACCIVNGHIAFSAHLITSLLKAGIIMVVNHFIIFCHDAQPRTDCIQELKEK
jgi:hypothetical protein